MTRSRSSSRTPPSRSSRSPSPATSGDSTTYAQDGNGNSSYNSGETQVFSSSSGTVSCNTPSGGTATCTQLPGGGLGVNPFLGFYNTGKTYLDALGNRGNKSTKTIAGRTAQCVSFTAKDLGGAALNGSAEYCVDKDSGVLLEIKTTDASGTESAVFTVTKYEEPSASDFTPPATPKTIPSVSLPSGVTYPSGITIPGGG